jgi:hypothetical protein
MIVYESDLKANAFSAMRDCMAYLSAGDMTKAHQCYGQAIAYENMLLDEGINLEEINANYREAKEIYWERTT